MDGLSRKGKGGREAEEREGQEGNGVGGR